MILSVVPTLLLAAYIFLPEFKELRATVPLLKPTEAPLIRYTDKSGRVSFVSSLEFVPEEYRDQVEINPNLPRVNRGEFAPVATPTASPTPRRRGGDSVMRNRYESRRKAEIDFSDDGFSKDDEKLGNLTPGGVLNLLSKQFD